MKRVWRLLAIALLVGVFALPARAAQFDSSQESIIVVETAHPRDLHLAGKNITVDADTKGDLLIAGGMVLSNGEVENSLFIAGGTVTVRSHVRRHVRIAGGTVTLSGKVDGDVFIAGGDVTITDSAEISGGLFAAGGTISVAGKIDGGLRLGGQAIVIDAAVGSATVYGDDIRLTSNARINGDFKYRSSKPAAIDSGASITGRTEFTKYQSSRYDKYGFLFGAVFSLAYLLHLLGAILLGWLLLKIWPRTARRAADFALSSPIGSIGYGLLTLIVVFIGGVVLAITVVGTSLAGVILALWLLTLMLGSITG